MRVRLKFRGKGFGVEEEDDLKPLGTCCALG